MDIWLQSLLSALAVWRITHLVSQEEGPWALCLKLRRLLSMWISLPFAAILPAFWSQRLIAWFAFSGAAILLERLTRDPLEIKIPE
jgi:hypothetical protein